MIKEFPISMIAIVEFHSEADEIQKFLQPNDRIFFIESCQK